MSKKAFLFIAHGSRRQASNQEVLAVVKQLQHSSLQRQFERIEGAFLECVSPSVTEKLEQLVTEGMTEMVLFPYFLAAGTHVEIDLPQLVAEANRTYPNCRFLLLPHLGQQPGLITLIEQSLN
ncbi:sirohydrochlorin chelatase [Celerinatantimonas sp. YJH-8]|uniref:sirohydrochlorin chelatase n=1 Tax=Celerinatantimonas sp. YJH-8 TaxID=3228714 RepID=UPI0038C3EBB7